MPVTTGRRRCLIRSSSRQITIKGGTSSVEIMTNPAVAEMRMAAEKP